VVAFVEGGIFLEILKKIGRLGCTRCIRRRVRGGGEIMLVPLEPP
jgi:hypothetical protein